jgi:hypothetical protein
MNQHDRDNLNFLLNCSQDQFDEWVDKATPDDVDYALELFQKAKSETILLQHELLDNVEMDLAEANDLINRIKNVGKI